MIMRQELDGPQAEQLEFVPCGQILQDEDSSRRIIGEVRPWMVRIHVKGIISMSPGPYIFPYIEKR